MHSSVSPYINTCLRQAIARKCKQTFVINAVLILIPRKEITSRQKKETEVSSKTSPSVAYIVYLLKMSGQLYTSATLLPRRREAKRAPQAAYIYEGHLESKERFAIQRYLIY